MVSKVLEITVPMSNQAFNIFTESIHISIPINIQTFTKSLRNNDVLHYVFLSLLCYLAARTKILIVSHRNRTYIIRKYRHNTKYKCRLGKEKTQALCARILVLYLAHILINRQLSNKG